MTRHADLIQQYAGTDGYCHLWAAALGTMFPSARIVSLMALDPRTFEAHDWPEDEPLELHRYALLGDGSAVDAQGRHTPEAMLAKFGIRPGWKHAVTDAPEGGRSIEAMETANPAHAAYARGYLALMRRLGWEEGVPEHDGELERNWKRVRAEAMENGVPDPEPAAAPAP